MRMRRLSVIVLGASWVVACSGSGGPGPKVRGDEPDPDAEVAPDPKPTPDAAVSPGAFVATVNEKLVPGQASLPDRTGQPQPVASSKDADHVVTDFIEGLVRLRPLPGHDLEAFTARYAGTVVGDDALPKAPDGLGLTLSEADRKPTEYLVRLDLSQADTSEFAAHAVAAGLDQPLELSSDAALRTLAVVADAVAAGFDATPDYVEYRTQTFPLPIFQTQEGLDSTGRTYDAFASSRFGSAGSQSNVTLAWQFVAAHGIQRQVTVAIIDDGFWLDTAGRARVADTDFPPLPAQWDFQQGDAIADGPGTTGCGTGSPCFWHGTGSAGVAVGAFNNMGGVAGTGGMVGSPLLLRVTGQRSQSHAAVRYAVALGVDVVSMSYGGDCNLACRIYDRDDTPFSDAVESGSRTVFVAAAGNGDSNGVGYDVGSPNFVHPCIEDHVICVGALNDDATTRIGYSNFGGQVQLFAPTNIPAMQRPASNDPNPAGPASPQTFGGTSAATPFVAGVAALMKAINPGLNSDQVATMLRDSAHPGAGQVMRYLDAYAAVRLAAANVPAVKDRFEVGPGGNDITATDLGAMAPYAQPNLNLSANNDQDVFAFAAPGASIMTVDLTYPPGLGSLSLYDVQTLGDCGLPTLVSTADLPGGGSKLVYNVPGGPQQIAVRGSDINAYNLSIGFSSLAIAMDDYEPDNNRLTTARYLYTYKSLGTGLANALSIEPRVTIDANLHSGSDVDYYIVRGAHLTTAEQVLLSGQAAVDLYDNESAIHFEVNLLNDDRTLGAAVATLDNSSCNLMPLHVPLEADRYYALKISGDTGRYTLRNGVESARRHLPDLVRDRAYVVLHPGEPVEQVIRGPEVYVFVGDPAYSQVRSAGTAVHLALLDNGGTRIGEGKAVATGESLSLAATKVGQVYVLQVTPTVQNATPPTLQLEWDAATAAFVSGNLIANPDAEIVVGSDPTQDVPGWTVKDGLLSPRIYFYDDQPTNPPINGPGPEPRGDHLFSGGANMGTSGVTQSIPLDPAWTPTIDAGGMKFHFSAFLGGLGDEPDHATATLTFLDANAAIVGAQTLAPITVQDRAGQSGLFAEQVEDYLPAGTKTITVDLTFFGGTGDFNDGYIDNLELTLSHL